MLMAKKGKLSVAQAIGSATAEISENVISIGSLEDVPENTFIDIETAVAASGSGALTIDLIIGDVEALDTNNLIIERVVIASEADLRIASAGAHVLGHSIPREVRELAELLSYDYLGINYTPTSTLAVSFNAAIGPSQPRTRDKEQVTVSNVGIPSTL